MREPFMLSFPLEEYRKRLDKLIAIMHRDGVNAVIFTSDNNTFYFSSFQSIVWTSKVSTPGVVVVTDDGDMALCTTKGGVAGQTRQSLENIRHILAEAGLSMANIVKTTVFLSDMSYFGEMNEVYAGYFEGSCPARSAVAVRALPKGALVEIECIAAR